MKISLFLIIILISGCSPFDGGDVRVDIGENKGTTNGAGVGTTYNFSTSDSSLSSLVAGISRVINLSYSETSNSLATTCEISNENKLNINVACSCDVAGNCSVTMNGTTGSLGSSSFKFRVGKNSQFSNWSTIDYSQTCPTGFIDVPADSTVSANNSFCVMRTEAKESLGYPVSTSTGFPWVSIDLADSKAACISLNTLNTVSNKYDIISNEEWMAISRNIEAQSSNWSNGIISSSNELVRGHSDSTPSNALDISVLNNPYDQTGNSSTDPASLGWEQRRTHNLSNGNIIWDFAGNVWELVDLSYTNGLQTLTPSKKPFSSADGASALAYRELSDIDRMIGENVGDVFVPSFWQPSHSTFNHDQGVGQYYAGADTSGGSLLRGGGYYNGNRSGIYAFTLDGETSDNGSYAGFRCVYRP